MLYYINLYFNLIWFVTINLQTNKIGYTDHAHIFFLLHE
jgi:hypothetical protein